MLLPANSCSGPQRMLFFLSCWTTHYYFTRGWSGNFGTHVWTSRWVSVFCAQLGSFYKLLIWSSFSRKQSKNIMNSFKQRKLKYFSFDATWCDIATWYDLMEREWTWTNLNVLPPRLKPPRSRSTTLATAVPSPAPAMALRASSGAIRETPLAFRVSWVWA